MAFFSRGLKNEFETAVVNELSVFESLKFYYTWKNWNWRFFIIYTAYAYSHVFVIIAREAAFFKLTSCVSMSKDMLPKRAN